MIAEFNLSGKTTTENNTTNVDSDRTNNLKVNGYDNSQLVTDTETTDNSGIEQTETKTRTETRENPSEVIERNIITQKNNKLVDMIVSDIKNTICLDSLDSCTINDDYSGGDSELKERVETLENKVETIESDILTIDVSDIKKVIPNNASENNKLATMADISGGGSVTIDDTLSTVSENPVQNKVITQKINQVENSIPDVSGLATKSELQDITDLIPSNATTSNKLATMADISGGGSSEVTISDTPEYLNEKVIIGKRTYKKYKVLLDLGANRQIIQKGSYDWHGWKPISDPYDTSYFYGKMKDFLSRIIPFAVLNIRLFDQSFTHYFDPQYVKIQGFDVQYMILPKIDFSTAPTNIYPSGTTASDFGEQTMRYIEVTYLI